MIRRFLGQSEKVHVFATLARAKLLIVLLCIVLAINTPSWWRWVWAVSAAGISLDWWHYRHLARGVEIVVFIKDGKAEGLKVPNSPDEIEWGDDDG